MTTPTPFTPTLTTTEHYDLTTCIHQCSTTFYYATYTLPNVVVVVLNYELPVQVRYEYKVVGERF